ncbi:MAG: hypothetical protein K1X53_17645 [Candidatus Sumerlaeaceae bacterium]|nr:hypothetical protein [Candidatus Sumerlaeaceae bacterium]
MIQPGLITAQSSYRVPPEEFAILPWGHTPATTSVLEGIRDCGFNLAGFVSADSVGAVEAAGLKCIVSSGAIRVNGDGCRMTQEEIRKSVSDLARQVGSQPAVFGFYLQDEPVWTQFPCLGKWAQAVRETAPNVRPYINLFPNYVGASALPNGNYDDYLTSFVEQVKPAFISYDHYAMMEDGSVKEGYFANLESVRAVGQKHGLPFWNIVLGNAHFAFAEPSPATLRFQVFTTLAYGGRGISYFTYFAPSIGNYRLAPIDQFGHKTPTWDMMRLVNLQIHALAPEYLKLKSINTFHHPTLPPGCRGLDSSRYLKGLSGGELLVGEFEQADGKPAMIVVNKSLTRAAMIDVALKKPGKIRMVNPYSGGIGNWDGENNWLAPGQGILLLVEPEPGA